MGTTQAPVAGGNLREVVSSSTPLTPGRLRGITVTIQGSGASPATNFIRVLIEGQNVGESGNAHQLASGYLGFETAITWTGDYPIGADDQLTLKLQSSKDSIAVASITMEPT